MTGSSGQIGTNLALRGFTDWQVPQDADFELAGST
jgi:hypothetical protein